MTDGHSAPALRDRRGQKKTRLTEDLSDRQLLERFTKRNEEAAFAALVQRHGSLVLGVCRRVLHNEHDAEDAFQATFLVLARKAAVISWQDSVTSWLHAVAHRLAMHARARTVRLRDRERLVPVFTSTDGDDQELLSVSGPEWAPLAEASHPQVDPLKEVARRELRLILDDELDRLPQKYRDPVVLCYLEGKTNAEAARELGWPLGSMSRRLARARALLQERLSRRGLAVSTMVLCVVLTALWGMKQSSTPDYRVSSAQVAAIMLPFKPVSEGGQGIDSAFLQLAQEPQEGQDHLQLTRMAHKTAGLAEMLKAFDPGKRHRDWQNLSDEMRLSALALADALNVRDHPAALVAARRLNASCSHCHEIYRY